MLLRNVLSQFFYRQKIENEQKMKKRRFSHRNFHVFSSFKCSFTGFNYFSVNFGAFLNLWEIQKSKLADPRWAGFGNHGVINYPCFE